MRYPSKYHNIRVETPEGKFDSKREAERYYELKLMERAGLISGLARQVRYELIPKVGDQRPTYYYADFVYRDKDGCDVVEDVKGTKTEVYKIKKKLMLWRYGINIKET